MDKLKIPAGVNPVTGKPTTAPAVDPKLETSASKMRDKAEAAAKAGKYGDAMEAYFAAEKLFRQAKSDAAADSMKAAAQVMATKAKKAGDKAYAQPDMDSSKIAQLKAWAKTGQFSGVKVPKGANPVTGKPLAK